MTLFPNTQLFLSAELALRWGITGRTSGEIGHSHCLLFAKDAFPVLDPKMLLVEEFGSEQLLRVNCGIWRNNNLNGWQKRARPDPYLNELWLFNDYSIITSSKIHIIRPQFLCLHFVFCTPPLDEHTKFTHSRLFSFKKHTVYAKYISTCRLPSFLKLKIFLEMNTVFWFKNM